MNTTIRSSAFIKGTVEDVRNARTEALKTKNATGKTKTGISFRKMTNVLVLF